MSEARTGEPVIVGTDIAAGHDGHADLIVTLRYGNGHLSRVVLDTGTGIELMRNCGVDKTSDLLGHSWRAIFNPVLAPERGKCRCSI